MGYTFATVATTAALCGASVAGGAGYHHKSHDHTHHKDHLPSYSYMNFDKSYAPYKKANYHVRKHKSPYKSFNTVYLFDRYNKYDKYDRKHDDDYHKKSYKVARHHTKRSHADKHEKKHDKRYVKRHRNMRYALRDHDFKFKYNDFWDRYHKSRKDYHKRLANLRYVLLSYPHYNKYYHTSYKHHDKDDYKKKDYYVKRSHYDYKKYDRDHYDDKKHHDDHDKHYRDKYVKREKRHYPKYLVNSSYHHNKKDDHRDDKKEYVAYHDNKKHYEDHYDKKDDHYKDRDSRKHYYDRSYDYNDERDIDVNNNVDVDVENDNRQVARSGDAYSKKNTYGGDVKTGDAHNENTTNTHVDVDTTESTEAAFEYADHDDDYDARVYRTGYKSHNRVEYDRDYDVDVENNVDVNVTNNNTQHATSGDAYSKYNTFGGDVKTGDATNTNNTTTRVSIAL